MLALENELWAESASEAPRRHAWVSHCFSSKSFTVYQGKIWLPRMLRLYPAMNCSALGVVGLICLLTVVQSCFYLVILQLLIMLAVKNKHSVILLRKKTDLWFRPLLGCWTVTASILQVVCRMFLLHPILNPFHTPPAESILFAPGPSRYSESVQFAQ